VLDWHLNADHSFQDYEKFMAFSAILGNKVAFFEALNGEKFVDFEHILDLFGLCYINKEGVGLHEIVMK
jgi:hypothetical protein